MGRIDRILERSIPEEEITWEEAKQLISEGGGFMDMKSVMDLMDQINRDQRNPVGQAPMAKAYTSRIGNDAIKITITNRGRPVAEIRLSLPGMVSLLSQYKR